MSNTHFITISKEEFDKIEVGDRLVIQNDEDRYCYVVYVENNDNHKMWVLYDEEGVVMKVFVIEKDFGSAGCWGIYESDWKLTNIIFTDESKAKEYVKYNADYYRYKTIETKWNTRLIL